MNDQSLATPEAPVRWYVKSVAANDFACALQAYAATEHARSDFTARARWVAVLSPTHQNAPAEYPMFAAMNEFVAKAKLAQSTKAFVYRILADTDPGAVQTVTSDDQISAFIAAVNPARLRVLKLVRVDPPRQLILGGAPLEAVFTRTATREGADEMTERTALYELDGSFFWSGFQLCRYGKTWKILDFAATASGPLGEAGKTTVAEYESRVQ